MFRRVLQRLQTVRTARSCTHTHQLASATGSIGAQGFVGVCWQVFVGRCVLVGVCWQVFVGMCLLVRCWLVGVCWCYVYILLGGRLWDLSTRYGMIWHSMHMAWHGAVFHCIVLYFHRYAFVADCWQVLDCRFLFVSQKFLGMVSI